MTTTARLNAAPFPQLETDMQKANILLNNGNRGESIIPKYGVTPSEVLVLEALHGGGSVTEIEVLDEEATDDQGRPLTSRSEIARLYEVYGRVKTPDEVPVIATLFPGAGARALDTFDELEWGDDRFKTPPAKAEGEAKPAKSRRKKAAEPVGTDDGEIEEINDGVSALS